MMTSRQQSAAAGKCQQDCCEKYAQKNQVFSTTKFSKILKTLLALQIHQSKKQICLHFKVFLLLLLLLCKKLMSCNIGSSSPQSEQQLLTLLLSCKPNVKVNVKAWQVIFLTATKPPPTTVTTISSFLALKKLSWGKYSPRHQAILS